MILLGDPHLGRDFKIGTPVHRRGEREASQWEDFRASLRVDVFTGLHVNMGDLFDSFAVSREVILTAAKTYKDAAREAPHCTFVILMGNHDKRRDADVVSSFDLFFEMVRNVPNIWVVQEKAVRIGTNVYCPWHPFKSAGDLLGELINSFHAMDWDLLDVENVFGHWDLETFGGAMPHNLIPARMIQEAFPNANVYTGHVHRKQVKDIDGLTVNVVGSMQPYAHGEGDELYVTLGLDELEGRREELKNKVVRLILKDDEVLSDPVDCLQFSYKRIKDDTPEAEAVVMGDFNFEAIFTECMGDNPLREELWQRYEEKRNAQAA